ncbi:MAG: hypothetical protein ACT4OU_04715 [Hyphomicrobium sp.]
MMLFTAVAARAVIVPAAVALGMTLMASSASAVSFRVKLACASDYYSYCSQHSPDTPGVRQCMRANGPKLSKSCVSALISAGEVSQTEVDRRRAAKQTASR